MQQHFKEYTKLQTALSTISWIQAAGFCLSWGLTTSLTRIIIELIFAGLGAGMFTTLLSKRGDVVVNHIR